MDASDYLAMLRRYWRSILLLTVIGGLLGLGGALAATPNYTSSAKVLFMGSDGPTIQLAVQSYAQLATTDAVLGPVAREVGADDVRELAGQVTSDSSLTSQVITISATDADADRSAELANVVAHTLVERAEALAADVGRAIARGSVVEEATPPVSPSSPEHPAYVVGGALLGMLVAVAQALVRFWRHRRGAPA